MARAFKKRVKPRPLHVGDLVLRVIRGLIRDPRGKFRPSWSGPYFIRELTPEGAAWLMDLDGNQFSEPTNVDQLKRHHWVHGSRDLLYLLHFIHEGMGFDHRVFELSFPSFLSPYHPSLHYVPCLKTTLRPWDRISSSTASMWTARFILFDIVVIPGWGYVECLDSHVIISVRSTSGLLCIPWCYSRVIRADRVHLMPYWGIFPSFSHGGDRSLTLVRRSRLVEPLLAISSSLRFAAACHTGAYFPHIVSLQSGVQSRRSFTVYNIQSHHVTFFSSAFRVVITSQFDVQKPSSVFQSDVQSRHHHFLVSAFRAIIGFQIDIQSRILGFDVQSRYRFSASAFRAIIGFQIDIQSRVLVSAFRVVITPQLRCSEPSSSPCFQFDVQNHHRFSDRHSRVTSSVSVFRVVITFQFGVQSHYRHLV
ncbi:hypothetical protein CK203_045636 [Vitis vinifera]|uniref:Uncharacterized protein n=1 Tax=Vitis vinifera TaxID=29760 RepID=A0A438HQ40_VITVI|nr:hypothetical protein CK203_045636 [Vitis vinifera]